jgi:DNA-binding transcriptional LysR family regulator
VDFRQLRYFLAVGEELSFSRAAERCFISQSAISHQVTNLEKELGTPLFERSTRMVRLTPAGARLVPIAQQVLALETQAHAVAREPQNHVRLAASLSLAPGSLDAVAAAQEKDPGLEIEFVVKAFVDRIEAVLGADADVGLIRGTADRPGLRALPVGHEDLVIATSPQHPLSAFSTVRLGDLAPYPLLLPPRASQVLLHRVIETAFDEVGRRRQLGPAVAQDHSAALEVIAHPRAWTVLYESTANEMRGHGLHLMRESQNLLRLPVNAVIREGEIPLGIARLLTALRAAFGGGGQRPPATS